MNANRALRLPNCRILRSAGFAGLLALAQVFAPAASGEPIAKQLFGSKALPADMKPKAVGFYSKGCLAGGIALPVDGPDWQVMRLSRNRRWGHPDLIRIIEELSIKAKQDGWNGLMVGDISQPRGGPMLTGHLSHQVGLDADIWFMPMPDNRLTLEEREETSAISVLKPGTFYVDDALWTDAHMKLLRHASKFPEVQRILVHPGVKKKLCDTVTEDRAWLSKIRPFYGHHYHFHIRIRCPEGSENCRPQTEVGSSSGCDSSLAWWFEEALKPKPAPKNAQPVKRKEMRLADLPPACNGILEASAKPESQAEHRIQAVGFVAPEIEIPKVDAAAILASKPIEASNASGRLSGANGNQSNIPIPTPRPKREQD